MNEKGYMQHLGRLKDMVIRGGENIYPREIEEFLHKHDKVADVNRIFIFILKGTKS
jgi:fatty-acyl-CoA synthase